MGKMSWKIVSLLDAIEDLRQYLNNYACRKSLTDPEVVSVSQRLDQLINYYQTLVSLLGLES